jgi:hypothetical protein
VTTAIAIPEPVESSLVLSAPDPLDALMRYAQMLSTAKEFAEYICMTPMVPAIYQGKPKHATVAILHGAELGLNPLQALQQIFTVHGMPAIYARTMVALLKSKRFRFKTIESGPERVVFTGTSPDGVETETSTWTIERAAQAGYVPTIDAATGEYKKNKNGNLIGNEKYLTEPENMLWAKAAAEVCRRLAPDVLLGISRTVEDIESEPVHVESERVSPAELLAAASKPTEPTEAVKTWTPPAEVAEPAEQQVVTEQAPSAEPQADPPMTKIQQRKVGRLMRERGIANDAEILAEIGRFLGRKVPAPADVTRAEAIRLLDHLENNTSAEPASPVAEKWERAKALLDQLGAESDDAKLMFPRNFLDRPHLTDPLTLSEADLDAVLAELEQLHAEEQAAGNDANGAAQ